MTTKRYYWTEDGMEPDNVNGGWVRASDLAGAADVLTESAKQHRQRGDTGHATFCDLLAAQLRGGNAGVTPCCPPGEPHSFECPNGVKGLDE